MKIKKRRNLKHISSTGKTTHPQLFCYTLCFHLPALDISIELRREPDVSEPDMPDPVVKLSRQMSDEGLFVPQSSITIQNVIGEGENH